MVSIAALQLITRLLTPADWERFDYYAAKIKVLDLCVPIHCRDPFKNKGHHYLFGRRPTPLLFPQLRILTWSSTSDTHLAPLLVGEQLERLSVTFIPLAPGHHNRSPEDLHAVFGPLPQLKRLHFYINRPHVVPLLAWNDLHSSDKLNVLHVNMRLHPDDMVRLALLPSLQELHFVVESGEDLVPLLAVRDQPIFPSLHTLSLSNSRQHSGASVRSCTALLQKIRPGVLQDVGLEVLGPSSSLVRDQFLSALCNHSSTLHKMRLVDVRIGHTQSLPMDDVFRDHDMISLLPLTNLTHLQLSFVCQYDLGDAMLLQMAASWPALESLRISHRTDVGWRQRSRVTFHGLAGLVKLCPYLCELTLAMDISRIGPEHGELVGNRYVATIDLLDSAIVTQDDEDVLANAARCFATLFPKLEEIFSSNPLWQLRAGEQWRAFLDAVEACWAAIVNRIRVLDPTRRHIASLHDNRGDPRPGAFVQPHMVCGLGLHYN
ncbi:uncharacterized protein FIBRA_03583 [Fibroporia radiculosa]|uniref:F-box domain-containing protein n=1 Tax=Fibroporia radiculosa TaxID=599839 RepID=J4HW26_9APHY|nr:uncharacterized protein FIBRA_03583 [Fibroporia radiculosa]CCM01527.1 predicted protein [Fibroporia radiculosa]